jgi:GT2 family glycosyltransferase
MLAIVIPSRDVRNLKPCLEAIHRHDPGNRVIVVNDGLAEKPSGCYIMQGIKPFIFARNANIGLRHAFGSTGCDAAILMNDDALLETPGGFTKMYIASRVNSNYGLISSSCNNVGNANQLPGGSMSLRREQRMLCFICVLIPWVTWERVGPLDEEFDGYGYEDDAYSLMVKRAGLKLGVYDGCFVNHAKLHSSFRSKAYPTEGFDRNRKLFIKKYGGHK